MVVETSHIAVPDLNRSLKKVILQRRLGDRGVVCHNQGGWHSTRDLLSWGDPCVQAILLLIAERAPRDMQYVTAWANINEPGDFNKAHTHSGGGAGFDLSGIFVVAGSTGDVVFEPGDFRVTPKPGLLAIFKSDHEHRVEPCDEQRITIAFNFARLRAATKE